MAVTLQLARITPEQLAECRRTVAVLDRLCSFTLVPASEHLDLDWAGDGLVRACEHARAAEAAAVRRAVTGDGEVNPAYRDQPWVPVLWRRLVPADGLIVHLVADGAEYVERLSVALQTRTRETPLPVIASREGRKFDPPQGYDC